MAPRLVLDARTLRLMAIAFLILAGLSIHRLWLADPPLEEETLVITGETMGTTYSMRIAGEGLTRSLRARVEAETRRRLEEVDGWMSNWNPGSEVSRFNAHRSTEPFDVSYETAQLVAFAVEVSKWSGGAFDVTVAPLVALWGFGNAARLGAPPTQEEIDALAEEIGPRLIRIGRGNPEMGGFLRKESPDVTVDLSAVAKGFGVDHLAAGLLELGREDFLVEIGGEVLAVGERPGGGPWRVAVEKPLDDARRIQAVVELRDQAMATSGDYRIFYFEDGRRISHTIDPRTGRPVEAGPASASVVAASATLADAWATTLMVMGEEGLALTESEGVGAMILLREADGSFTTKSNALFPPLADGKGATAGAEQAE